MGGVWAADVALEPIVKHFRIYVESRLQVSKEQKTSTLAVAVKTNRQTALNKKNVFQWLLAFAKKRQLVFKDVDFGETLQAQARLLASASVLVASAGSRQFVGFFLQPGAGVLILPMCVAGLQPGSIKCYSEQLLACCGFKWAEYPVHYVDTVFTIGRGFDYVVHRMRLEASLTSLLDSNASVKELSV